MKILWLYDSKGWCFHGRALMLSKRMPTHSHTIVQSKRLPEIDTSRFDLVCCPTPKILAFVSFKCKVVAEIQSTRGL